MYINDLVDYISHTETNLILYAVDIILYARGETISTACSKTQECCKKLEEWCKVNKLLVTTSKTKHMLVNIKKPVVPL